MGIFQIALKSAVFISHRALPAVVKVNIAIARIKQARFFMASAVSKIKSSLIFWRKVFQLLHPIGGVGEVSAE